MTPTTLSAQVKRRAGNRAGAGAIGGAVTTIALYVGTLAGLDPPAPVGAALAVLVGYGCSFLPSPD